MHYESPRSTYSIFSLLTTILVPLYAAWSSLYSFISAKAFFTTSLKSYSSSGFFLLLALIAPTPAAHGSREFTTAPNSDPVVIPAIPQKMNVMKNRRTLT